MNEPKKLIPWSDCQLVVVETDDGDVDAVTLLEALMRLPSEHGSGRPEFSVGEPVVPPAKPKKTKIVWTTCSAIIEVPDDDDDVPEIVLTMNVGGISQA